MSIIKSSREIDAVFRAARRIAHPLLIVLVTPTPEERGPSGRVAFVAGKKLGSAVLRNRSRRVMREAARRCGGPWPGWDVVLIARSNAAEATPSELDKALRTALDKVKIL